MKFFHRPFRWAITYSTLLTIFSTYILLDAFVIPKAQIAVQSSNTQSTNLMISESEKSITTDEAINEETQPTIQSTDPIITDSSYDDGTLSITLSTTRDYDSDIYIVDIKTEDPSLLKTAFAQDLFGRNIKSTTSEIAETNQAILAINGDYYGFRDDGAVLRNGVLYRSTMRQGDITDALFIDNHGLFSIVDESTNDISTMDLTNVAQIFSFGPTLVNNGVSVVSESDEVDTKSDSLLNPRTAIGMVEQGHYIIIVVDGRTQTSNGVSLSQLSQLFVDLGVQIAYNLDGGGSSTLVFNGTLINTPTTNGNKTSEREVSDIVYFGY